MAEEKKEEAKVNIERKKEHPAPLTSRSLARSKATPFSLAHLAHERDYVKLGHCYLRRFPLRRRVSKVNVSLIPLASEVRERTILVLASQCLFARSLAFENAACNIQYI